MAVPDKQVLRIVSVAIAFAVSNSYTAVVAVVIVTAVTDESNTSFEKTLFFRNSETACIPFLALTLKAAFVLHTIGLQLC